MTWIYDRFETVPKKNQRNVFLFFLGTSHTPEQPEQQPERYPLPLRK